MSRSAGLGTKRRSTLTAETSPDAIKIPSSERQAARERESMKMGRPTNGQQMMMSQCRNNILTRLFIVNGQKYLRVIRFFAGSWMFWPCRTANAKHCARARPICKCRDRGKQLPACSRSNFKRSICDRRKLPSFFRAWRQTL